MRKNRLTAALRSRHTCRRLANPEDPVERFRDSAMGWCDIMPHSPMHFILLT